jgi:hypothetical protein
MPRAASQRSNCVSVRRHSGVGEGGSSPSVRFGAVAGFFIDVETGRVATHSQLIAAGKASGLRPPRLPWHPVQGPLDASTVLYSIFRKRVSGRERAAWIGMLCIRHADRQASMLAQGWEEVPVDEIRAGPAARSRVSPQQTRTTPEAEPSAKANDRRRRS